MLEILDIVEKELPRLLKTPSDWKGMFIDYDYPHVARIWRPWNGYRISLHNILKMPPDAEPLLHPHPWPQAVRILSGRYEMGIGSGKESAKVVTKVILKPGSLYEMIDPDGWHYVKPLESCYSLMVTGKPWDRPSFKSPYPMRELTSQEWETLYQYFCTNYPERS